MNDGHVRRLVAYEGRGSVWRAVCLGLSVFGAALLAPGRSPPEARAQTLPAAGIGPSGVVLQMNARVRDEVTAALRAMSDRDLAVTYARINAIFREFLGHDDLSVARALIDYAALAEAELDRRGQPLPPGTESAAQMSLAYELVL
jgi:hypothetical protein